jgi:hypothetical protein
LSQKQPLKKVGPKQPLKKVEPKSNPKSNPIFVSEAM